MDGGNHRHFSQAGLNSNLILQDFPGGSGVKTPTPTAGGTDSIPGQGTKILHREFSGGPGVKNLPANAGDMVSFPDLGRSHMLQATKAVSHNY